LISRARANTFDLMRYLAIDYGLKRTGLATCDRDETICSPLSVLQTDGSLIKKINEAIQEYRIETVIVGLPINMDDTEGPQAKKTRKFAAQLKQNIDIELQFHDERLSSFDAEVKLVGLDLTRGKKKKHLDAIAAAAILESYLYQKNSKNDS